MKRMFSTKRRSLIILVIIILAVIIGVVGWERYGKNLVVPMRSLRVKAQIVVFESDDWHLRGTPSPEVLEKLKNMGYKIDFWAVDALETTEDLDALFAVLLKHKDSTGRPPCITANFVMTNPDFAKIKESNFEKYFVIPQKDDWNEGLLKAYRQGIKERVFYPQVHGYEHMCGDAWLRQLREDKPEFRMLFDLGLHLDPITAIGKPGRSAAEFVDLSTTPSTAIPYETQLKHLSDAQDIFEDIFGFRSTSFIAPFYYFDDNTLKACNAVGIKYIQAGNSQCEKVLAPRKFINHRRYLGDKTGHGDGIFLNRNCYFDPAGSNPYDATDCIKHVGWAFDLGLPAVIDTHRIYYMSTNDPEMAKKSREQLDKLLTCIETLYPNVRYLTTPELGELISTGQYRDVFSGEVVQLPVLVAWKTKIPYVATPAFICLGGLIFLYVFKRRKRKQNQSESVK